MITGQPDTSLNLNRLEQEMKGLRSEAASSSQWVFREKYVDRGKKDPFYIIQFKEGMDDGGDDLMNEPLFITRHAAIRVKHITRQKEGEGEAYWRPIEGKGLVSRLERFMTMFRNDYLQPPGAKGDLINPDQQHDIFEKKRFIYRISSPQKTIIGIGSKMFAGAMLGAVRGVVTDESGNPMDNAVVELVSAGTVQRFSTKNDGKFWFSVVPPGTQTIRVKDRTAFIIIEGYECFGNIKGALKDAESSLLPERTVEFHAPDEAVFTGISNSEGRFSTGPLPAFPYIMRIPGFLFTAGVNIVSDTEISGTLLGETGRVLGGKDVILKQDGTEVARQTSDGKGRFKFTGLKGCRFSLSVPGYRLYLRKTSGASIQGKISGVITPVEIELLAQEQVVGTTRSTASGAFRFDNLDPGSYALRSEDRLIAKVEAKS